MTDYEKAQRVFDSVNNIPDWVEDDYCLLITWSDAEWIVTYLDDGQIQMQRKLSIDPEVGDNDIEVYSDEKEYDEIIAIIADETPTRVCW